MKQTKPVTWTLWVVTALALGAGVVAGLVVDRLVRAHGSGLSTATTQKDTLAETLHLSDQQRKQMRDIWETAHLAAVSASQDAQDVQHDRDNAVFSILSTDQKLQYDRLTKQCVQKIDSLKGKRDQAVQEAIAQTRQILSPDQRERYELIIHDRLGKPSSGLAAAQSVDAMTLADAIHSEGMGQSRN